MGFGGTEDGAARGATPPAPAPCGRRAPYWPSPGGWAREAREAREVREADRGEPRVGPARALLPGGRGSGDHGGAVSARPLGPGNYEGRS